MGLILPSSARVSLVTYQTVIAVRYPDLVHIDSGAVSYGMFFSADPGQAGGFLPIVARTPRRRTAARMRNMIRSFS